MSEALTAAPSGPETDALVSQNDPPNPQTNLIPEVEEKSPESKRSDAVRKAIDKALVDGDGDDVKPEPKAKPEVKAEPKPDAKVEPKPEATKEAETAPPGAKTDAQEKTPPKPSAYREPPSGFDDAAKKEWEAVPESVRGAVHRRAQEMERGIHKYRQDAEQFEPVRQFAEMAKQGGTDLPTALHRYVGMENELRRDPISGLQAVVANLGLKKPDGSAVTLRDVAANIMGQSPDQAASRQEATISQMSQRLAQQDRQIEELMTFAQSAKETQAKAVAGDEWTNFQRDNPDAKDLEKEMADALQMQNAAAYPSLTERLRHAYAVARSLNPSVAHTDIPPLVQTQTAPRAANPAGQKSISGAPGAIDARPNARKLSRRESIDKAMRAAGI